ncbi:MAG: hypothetical protein Q9202_002315 [Teloschistes flavicans]
MERYPPLPNTIQSQTPNPTTNNTPPPSSARLVLSYKNLPYTTHFLEYPAIAPFLTSLSIPPNPPSLNATPYTLPVLRLPDGTHIMDSKAIATALETLHPSPPLHLDSPALARVEALWPQIMAALRGVIMPLVPRTLLSDASIPYFEATREQRFGMPLARLAQEVGGEKAWEAARPLIRELGQLLRENEAGVFLGGEEVGYADFVLVGAMEFFRRIGEGLFERLVAEEEAFGRLYEACRGWVQRDD